MTAIETAVHIVLRHPDAEQLWVNDWVRGTVLISSITTDKTVADQCRDAQQNGEYIYVHRTAFGAARASVVSKAKVQNVHEINARSYWISFRDQLAVGRDPLRQALQGDHSYVCPAGD